MLKIVILASFLCAVRGAKYAYIGNQLVKFDDAPKTFSFTYPNIKRNQGLQIIREQNTSEDDNVAETPEASTITQAVTTPTVTTTPTLTTTPTVTTTPIVTTTPAVTTIPTVTTTPTITTPPIVTIAPTVTTTPTITTTPTVATTPAITTTTTETQIDSISTLPGLISSLIWKIIIFVKKVIIKFITAGLSFIFGFISVPAGYLTSMSKYYNIGSLPNMSQLSSLVNPERLKRAAFLLEKEIKKIGL